MSAVATIRNMSQRILLAFLLGLPFLGLSQGFNGGFEQLGANGIPLGWTVADPSGASTTKEANIGKLAAKSWVYKNYESGVWNSNISPEEGNAAELTGYYKYVGEKSECEKATVSYILGAKTAEGGIDTLAFGDTELKLNKKFDKFSIAVSATGTGVPDFVNIQFKPRGHCNMHGETNCCFLFVDDIVLGGRTSTDEVIPEEAPVEEAPAEELSDSVLQGVAPAETVTPEATEVLEEAIDKAADPEITEPAEGEMLEENLPDETPAIEETPIEEIPAEEESTEPVDEEWDSEEESSDGGR